MRYGALGNEALNRLFKSTGIGPDDVDRLIVTGPTAGPAASLSSAPGSPTSAWWTMSVPPWATPVRRTPSAAVVAFDGADPDADHRPRVVLADGAEALVVRTTPDVAWHRVGVSLARQIEGGAPISYGRYLAWRGLLPVEPPRRPEPARTSSSAAGRSVPWKFGFEGSRSTDGTVHLPPLPDDVVHQPMAEARGTVTTFTIDRLSYTPSPPLVFAVVDFEGGGRLPVELTDVDAADVRSATWWR